jgi:hypothetical protein
MQQGYNSHSLLLDHSFNLAWKIASTDQISLEVSWTCALYMVLPFTKSYVADHGNLCRWHTIILLTLATTSLLWFLVVKLSHLGSESLTWHECPYFLDIIFRELTMFFFQW